MKFSVEFWWKMLLTIFPSKRSSKISFQTLPEVRHQFRRKLPTGDTQCVCARSAWAKKSTAFLLNLAHQNRTIAIASDVRVDGVKSPEIPQKEGVSGSEIAAIFAICDCDAHRRPQKSLAISGVCDGHRNRKSQKSLRFRCAKLLKFLRHARLL